MTVVDFNRFQILKELELLAADSRKATEIEDIIAAEITIAFFQSIVLPCYDVGLIEVEMRNGECTFQFVDNGEQDDIELPEITPDID